MSGDPGRVRQVLTNLIGNAIKFTAGRRGRRPGHRAPRSPATRRVVRFEVSDTGDGIAPDKLDADLPALRPGRHVDLAQVRRHRPRAGHQQPAGRAHGRRLRRVQPARRAEARSGSRSAFTPTPSARPHEPLPPDAGLAGVSALIVDDNATQRGVLSEYLTDWGMTVTTADSGEAALTTLRDGRRPRASRSPSRSSTGRMPGDGRPASCTSAIVADPTSTARLVLMTGLGQERDVGDAGRVRRLRIAVQAGPPRAICEPACGSRSGLQVADGAVARGRRRAAVAGAGRELGRLLLAEDNLDQPEGRGRDARRAPATASTPCSNGAAAVAAVAGQRYDAILMDCQMPELNGYEATAAIRAHEGPDARTPDHRHDRRRPDTRTASAAWPRAWTAISPSR